MSRTLRSVFRIAGGPLAFLLLSVPSALTEDSTGVSGIALEALPNAVSIHWVAPPGMSISRYVISYARQSIVENNGRFDEQEATDGAETSLVLLDLKNRGLQNGDVLFVTVTAVDANGAMTAVGEEKNIAVQIPGSAPENPTHAAGEGTPMLEHAVAESATSVLLHFSHPMKIPTENPTAHFAITEEVTTNAIGIVTASVAGQDITLTTFSMTPRGRYVVAVSDMVTASDGTPLDPTKRSTVFVARGDAATTVPPTAPPPTVDLPPPPDVTAPEAPRMLTLRKILQKNGLYTVHASWQESLNTEGDLAAYHLYESADLGKTFAPETALTATVTSTTIMDVPPGTLTVKVTAADEVPNESDGVEETIILPETGAALLLGLSALGAGMGTVVRGKKRL